MRGADRDGLEVAEGKEGGPEVKPAHNWKKGKLAYTKSVGVGRWQIQLENGSSPE